MSTFDSTKLPLPQILADITAGRIQLPDFQRGWVWDDAHVKSLLVSVARSFPVGAVMMLDAGGDVRFRARPFAHVDGSRNPPAPDRLVLDGQQRLTALAQVLATGNPVSTKDHKGARIRRHYYIDIAKALRDDGLEEAFLSVPEDRRIKTNFNRDVRLDLSTRQLELQNFCFPCSEILDSDEWEYALNRHASERQNEFFEFRKKVVSAFRNYQLPVIALGRATTKEAVCLVFEKVNTGGVQLSVFELVTATFSVEDFKLRDDWKERRERLRQEPILADVEPTDFLQAVSILHTYGQRRNDLASGKKGQAVSAVSAKRAAILSLKLDAYKNLAPRVEQGFLEAARFMRNQYFFEVRELPYRTQLVALAALLSQLEGRWREPRIHDRLCQWFWCGVLGELYGGSTETRMANDFEDLVRWFGLISDDSVHQPASGPPRTVSDAAFQESRLDTLRSRTSAAYKGLNVLVLREGAMDFFWKDTIQALNYEDMALDIHHIFPRAWCRRAGIRRAAYDSVVNRTSISSKANRMIGGRAPSEYLAALQSHRQVGLTEEGMNRILASHRIPHAPLRSDDFHAFYIGRKHALIRLVETAMGKSVQRDQSQTAGSLDAADGTPS